MAVRLTVALVLVVGCDRGPEIDSCADSLAGVWRDPADRAWAVLDNRATLEIYPAFADNEAPPGAPPALEVAPRAIDLVRRDATLTGVVRRRFMLPVVPPAQMETAKAPKPPVLRTCEPSVTVRIIACRGRTLELALPEPPLPTSFDPCVYPDAPLPAPTRWTWQSPLR